MAKFWSHVTVSRDCSCEEWDGTPVEPEKFDDGQYRLRCPRCFMPWTVDVEILLQTKEPSDGA